MGEDLRSSGEGLRGFKSHPPHLNVEIPQVFNSDDVKLKTSAF